MHQAVLATSKASRIHRLQRASFSAVCHLHVHRSVQRCVPAGASSARHGPICRASSDDESSPVEDSVSGDDAGPTPNPNPIPTPGPATASAAWSTFSTSESSSGPSSTGSTAGVDVDLELAIRRASRLRNMKAALLAKLASLDRGLAASVRAAAEVEELCSLLEGLSGAIAPLMPPKTSTTPHTPTSTHKSTNTNTTASSAIAPINTGATARANTMPSSTAFNTEGTSTPVDLLAGVWTLVYSSGFNTGSLGGRRPGPPAALVPASLGQVYQRIDPSTGKLDNIVEFLFSLPQPGLALQSLLPGPKAQAAAAEARRGSDSPSVRLTLRHDYELASSTSVRITFEETLAQALGLPLLGSLPELMAPALPEAFKPPKALRSATFDIVFLDKQLRITRGDRGELRIYLRDDPRVLTASRGSTTGSEGMPTQDPWLWEEIDAY